jgi:hypothetical protein
VYAPLEIAHSNAPAISLRRQPVSDQMPLEVALLHAAISADSTRAQPVGGIHAPGNVLAANDFAVLARASGW